MFHTMALFAVGVIQRLNQETSFSIAAGDFVGIILFSGSLIYWPPQA